MSHEPIDVRYVADLARIKLSDEECERFGKQLNDILGHVKKLSEIDVTGVAPSAHPFDLRGNMRLDEAIPSLAPEDFLRNAPDQAQGQLRTPKVVDA